MQREYVKEYSHHLGREMEFLIYGHTGKPVIVFPTGNGRFWQYEEHGMVNAIGDFIDSGQIQLFCVDGVDPESWNGKSASPADRIRRQEQYFLYASEEVIPKIKGYSKSVNGGQDLGLMATGCSMGAFHSAITLFRRPDLIDTAVCLSGAYDAGYFMKDYKDSLVYLNSPLDFLENLHDENHLNLIRQARLVFCVGQGAWEDQMIKDTRSMDRLLKKKHIPAFVDFWGKDVNHDWDWWFKQMNYFLPLVLAD